MEKDAGDITSIRDSQYTSEVSAINMTTEHFSFQQFQQQSGSHSGQKPNECKPAKSAEPPLGSGKP